MREGPTPSVGEILTWLRGITQPVHGYLLGSIAFRILNLTLDVALFATAAGGVVHVFVERTGAGRLILLLGALAVAKGAAYYLEQFMGHHVAFKAVELLREHVYDAVWPKAPAISSQSRSGDVFARLTHDVDRIDIVYAHIVARFVSAYVVGAAAMMVAVMWLGWAHVWVMVLALAISLLVVPYLGLMRALGYTAQSLEERGLLAQHLTDTQFGLREILGYGRGDQRLREVDAFGRRIGRLAGRARRVAAIRRALNQALMLGAVIAAIYLTLGALPLAAVAALAGGTLRAFEGARAVEDATGYIDYALGAARRLWTLSHTPQRVPDGGQVLTLHAPPLIEYSGVQYRYPETMSAACVPVSGPATATGFAPGLGPANVPAPLPTLSDVDLKISPGEHLVIVGRSGSGKSTLVNLLQRYDDPSAGSILFDGKSLDSFTLQSLRAVVASVSQRSQLLHATIAENLRLGVPGASEEELWEVLDVTMIAEEIRAMPAGLETVVGEGATALSGGQIARISLARSLLMRPRVLILDEFTAHLNIELEEEIWPRLIRHLEGVTLIEVTHRLRADSGADAIIVVEEGRIVTRGTPAQITPGALEELFRGLRLA